MSWVHSDALHRGCRFFAVYDACARHSRTCDSHTRKSANSAQLPEERECANSFSCSTSRLIFLFP